MFALEWVVGQAWFLQMFFYFVLMMFLFLLGFWSATVYKRWQATGTLIMCIAITVLLLAAAALLTWQDRWPASGTWVASLTPATTGLLALVLSALLGVGALLTLRRATP